MPGPAMGLGICPPLGCEAAFGIGYSDKIAVKLPIARRMPLKLVQLEKVAFSLSHPLVFVDNLESSDSRKGFLGTGAPVEYSNYKSFTPLRFPFK